MIYRKKRWISQPQTAPQIDWGNPLTERMTFAWTASNGYRESVANDFKNSGVNDNLIVNGIGSSRGIVQRTSVDGSVFWGLHGRTVNKENNEFTIGCVFQVRNLAGDNPDIFNVTNSGFYSNKIGFVASKIRGSTTNANTTVDSNNNIAVGDWVYAVYVLKNDAFELYVDGIKQTATGTGTLPTQANPYNRVEINPSRVNLLMAFVVAKPWTQTQVSAWSANPWQLFAPQKSMTVFLSNTFSYSRPIADLSNSGWVRVP